MIARTLLPLLLGGLLSSCAVQGVVTNKTFQSLPCSHSTGVDGIYRLELQTAGKSTQRQMVQRNIFAAYEIGDEFNPSVPLSEMRRRNLARREAAREAELWALREKEMQARRAAANNSAARIFLRPEMMPETEAF